MCSTLNGFSNSKDISNSLLALRLVLCLGRFLGRSPPLLVVSVPLDGSLEALGEVGVLWLPAQLRTQLRRIDGVAAVVTGTVAYPIKIVGGLAHTLEDGMQNVNIVLFAVGADKVCLAVAALSQDSPYGGRVILGMDPVAHVQAIAIQLWLDAAQNVGDLARNELLHMLEGAVVVRAVGYGSTQTIGSRPRTHQHVTSSFSGAIRRAGLVRRFLSKTGRIVQCKVAVHFVGAYVVVTHVVLATCLKKAVGALHVGAQEWLGVGDGIVVVAFGGIMHNGVAARHDALQQIRIADIAHYQLYPVGGQTGNVFTVAGIGKLV